MYIIGKNTIIDSLEINSANIKEIYCVKGVDDKKINKIKELAKLKHIIIKEYQKNDFKELFDSKDKSEGVSQGIAALLKDFDYIEENQLLTKLSEKNISIIVLLDEIQDPHNLGAIIRTASSAGADGLLISEKNSAKINQTVFKTSAGAINYMDICLIKNIYKTILNLKNAGYKVIGTDLNSKLNLFHYKFDKKTCIVFGNESEGLRTNIKRLCDQNIKIPVKSRIDSLNVSVSAGVILYEIHRQLNETVI